MKKQNKRNSIIIVLLFLLLILNFFINKQLAGVQEQLEGGSTNYTAHYVLVVENFNDPFWQNVYEAAKAEGKKEGIYVELLGEALDSVYTVNERLKMAIYAKVDGILVEPVDEESELLMEEAMKKGIPVVTLLSDSTKGMRNSFIGVNSSKLGKIYGEQIKNLNGDITKVMLLVNQLAENTSQNMISLGIKESLEETGAVVEVKRLDRQNAFSSEEVIRSIVLRKTGRPDVLVCLSAEDTLCAYQALVDYNQVGTIRIIGYYDSKEILEAIQKGVISATIAINDVEMGEQAIRALVAVQKTGQVNAYFTVSTEMISGENVEDYLEKRGQ